MDWQQTLIRIMESNSDDLFELARIAGYDPVSFYCSADFRGVRVTTSEIRALELTDNNLDGAYIVEDELDAERDILAKKYMDELRMSGSFAQTHSVVAQLLRLGPFSGTAIDLYMDAVENNTQVQWIMSDDDLVQLAAKIDSSSAARYSSDRLERLRQVRAAYGPGREESQDPQAEAEPSAG